jgi:K+-transporting ATPase A subunit
MKKILYTTLLIAMPAIVSAQAFFSQTETIIKNFAGIVNITIPIAFGLAILYFFYGVAQYILYSNDPKKLAEAKQALIYGTIAIVVMGSLAGLVDFLQKAFGLQAGDAFAPAGETTASGLLGILLKFSYLLGLLVPIIFGLAIIFFFYGVIKFIRSAGDSKKLEDGKQMMIYGVISIFVMASLWGILIFIGDAFNISVPKNGQDQRTIPFFDVRNINKKVGNN